MAVSVLAAMGQSVNESRLGTSKKGQKSLPKRKQQGWLALLINEKKQQELELRQNKRRQMIC